MNATRTQSLTRRIAAVGATVAVAVPMGLLLSSPASAASTAETADMLRAMVAEEKLAHDVYVTLGDIYGVRTFANISRAEAQHGNALRTIMATYGVADPTVGDAVGVFDDPAVQALYDSLVKEGSVSLAAAAQVGITIEKLDIADLEEALANDHPADVTRVLDSLMAGSERHLDAFTRLADAGASTGDGSGQQSARGGRGSQQNGRGDGAGRGSRGPQMQHRSAGVQQDRSVNAQDGTCVTGQQQ